MSEERKEIKMMAAVVNASGEPDFFFCKVKCNDDEIDNGEHYDAARALAEEEGYEVRLVYDQMDSGGQAIQHIFCWDSATLIDLEKKFV